jgi:hypothetical protein
MDWQRAAIRRAIACGLILVVGLVIVALGSEVVGWTIAGVGLTLLIALGFYEIGLSEDRDRERRGR